LSPFTDTSTAPPDNEADAVERYCGDLLRVGTLAYFFTLQAALRDIELHVTEDVFGPLMDDGSSAVALTRRVSDVFEAVSTASRDSCVPKVTAGALLGQMIKHIDAMIFNKVLKGGHYCSPTSALRVKMFVSSVEAWLHQSVTPYGVDASPAKTFQYTRQGCVLLLLNKDIVRQPALRQDVCPALSLHHVLHIIEVLDQSDGSGACREVIRDLRGQLKGEPPKKYDALTLPNQQTCLMPRWDFTLLPEYLFATPPAKFYIPALHFLWPEQQ